MVESFKVPDSDKTEVNNV